MSVFKFENLSRIPAIPDPSTRNPGNPFILLLILFLLTAFPAMVQGGTPLKADDRVVIYGDSITEQRLYSLFLQQYIQCRYPDLKIKFFNAGWGGDRAPGGLNRLERDVLFLEPTVVTLFFGMNDGSYTALNDNILKTYRDGMEGIIKALQAKNIRVVIFTPGCVDYDRQKRLGECEYNKNLEALGKACRELAEKYQCDFVDVHHPMVAFQEKHKADQAGYTMIPDSVHPDQNGHMVMARYMLTAFAEPAPLLGTVDLKSGKSEGLKIVSKSDQQVVLQGKLKSFPFWIRPESMATARDCGMIDFAMPRLIVRGLSEGVYDVHVDGKIIQSGVSEKDLSAGVALPVSNPCAEILHHLIFAKESNYFTAWRNVRLKISDKEYLDPIYRGLMDADKGYQDAIWSIVNKLPEVTISIIPKPEGANLAFRKKYQCSDPNKYNWGIGGLTDGSWTANNPTCFATGDTAVFPKQVTIDLERPSLVSSVVIGVPPFGSTKTVTVSLSEDNKTFSDIGKYDFSLRKEERHTFSFKPVKARYVKLTYVENYPEDVSYSHNFAFTTEVEVYGKPAK